jgi:ribosome-associated protein
MKKTESPRGGTGRAARLPEPLRVAMQAAFDKKAQHVAVLDLRAGAAFTDFFVICTGGTARQVKAIVEAIEHALREAGERPAHVEGGEGAEWVLLDYFDFVVHVFTPGMRAFYALERLWGAAEHLEDLAEADLK